MAVGERRKRENRAQLEVAWLSAVLSRAKKIPSLREILGEKPPKSEVPEEGTAEHAERLARLKELAAKGPPIG